MHICKLNLTKTLYPHTRLDCVEINELSTRRIIQRYCAVHSKQNPYNDISIKLYIPQWVRIIYEGSLLYLILWNTCVLQASDIWDWWNLGSISLFQNHHHNSQWNLCVFKMGEINTTKSKALLRENGHGKQK